MRSIAVAIAGAVAGHESDIVAAGVDFDIFGDLAAAIQIAIGGFFVDVFGHDLVGAGGATFGDGEGATWGEVD